MLVVFHWSNRRCNRSGISESMTLSDIRAAASDTVRNAINMLMTGMTASGKKHVEAMMNASTNNAWVCSFSGTLCVVITLAINRATMQRTNANAMRRVKTLSWVFAVTHTDLVHYSCVHLSTLVVFIAPGLLCRYCRQKKVVAMVVAIDFSWVCAVC